MRVPLAALSALMILTACRDELPTSPNPQRSVLDAPATFTWLPPVVKQSNATFANDATLLPHVRVRACVISTGACAVLSGLRANDDEYHVNWNTSKNTPASRLLVDVAGTLVGQIDITPKSGQTIPVKFKIARNTLHVVGASGGAVSSDGVVLSIPQGALDQSVAITVTQLADYPRQVGVSVIGTVHDFAPDGITFDPPARITLRYDEASLPPGVRETDLSLGHLENGRWTVIRNVVIDTNANTISGPVSGFSAYGVVYSVGATSFLQTLWGRGGTSIDGTWNAAHWANAAHDTFNVNLPDGTSTLADYYVMNDDMGVLYIAIRFPRTSLDLETHVSIHSGQDEWGVSRFANGPTFMTDAWNGALDTDQGGTLDTRARVENDGQYTTIIVGHLFNSTDDAHDISAAVGDLVPYNLVLMLSSGNGLVVSQAPFPSVAGRILITDHRPVMSGMGTATIDGVISAGEWDLADCMQINIKVTQTATIPAGFCVMNDGVNLYVWLNTSNLANNHKISWALHMDQNGSGNIHDGDDMVIGTALNVQNFFVGMRKAFFEDQSWFTTGGCPVNNICSTWDTNRGGSTDGAAMINTGARLIEMSHPLNSGDVFDIAKAAGDLLGISMTIAFSEVLPWTGPGAPPHNEYYETGPAFHTFVPINNLITYVVR